MKFTTKDRDNDLKNSRNYAIDFKSAWWYISCHESNLNDQYLRGQYLRDQYLHGQYLRGRHVSYADGVNWYPWKRHYYSLKKTGMKFRNSDWLRALQF